jgi:hypothetical protein
MTYKRHRRLGVIVALACCVAGPATAKVVDSSSSGFSLENHVEVATDADTTWKALVEDVGRWWPRDHTWWGEKSVLEIEPRAGGCFCERHEGNEALHMLVTFVQPGELLRMTGGLGPLQGMGLHGVLEFRLAEAQTGTGIGGTRVTMFYRAGGYTPDDLSALAPVVDAVQALQLGGLASYLRGSPPGP